MEKALLRFRFQEPVRLERMDLDQTISYLLQFLKANLRESALLCIDSFKGIDKQPAFETLDATGGSFSFIEIIAHIDSHYIQNCNAHKDEIVDYLLAILQQDSTSLTDVSYNDDDKYITLTSHLPLPL